MTERKDVSQAVDYLNCNQPENARAVCLTVLHDEPHNAKAWQLCGVSHAQQNALQEALQCFRNATSLEPANALYHYNLARTYAGLGQLDQALSVYRQAIANKDDFLEARLNLANVLIDRGDNLEAIACFRELLEKFPDASDAHYNFANLLQDTGNFDESIEHYQSAIELNSGQSAARENLGRALTDAGRLQEAQQTWNAWLEFDPTSATARHMVAATSGQDVPDRCADDCIRETFNEDFSKNFDVQLARLHYRAPELIGDVVKAIDAGWSTLDVLDAGCGTGLCARFVRPVARRLVGVDLSEDMLVEAHKRQEYDELTACELTHFLDTHPHSFDLIISADTLCYFGRLIDVLAAARHSLRANGRLIFTVERDESENHSLGYKLGPQGRYRHAEGYVRQVLADTGFSSIDIAEEALRKECGSPVGGLVVSAC